MNSFKINNDIIFDGDTNDFLDIINRSNLIVNSEKSSNNVALKRDLGYSNQDILNTIYTFEELYNIVIPDSMLLDKVLFEDFDPTVNDILEIIAILK